MHQINETSSLEPIARPYSQLADLPLSPRRRRRSRPAFASVAGFSARSFQATPKRLVISCLDGGAPLGVDPSAARIAERCSGLVPQHPPMIRTPKSRAISAYSAINSGVP